MLELSSAWPLFKSSTCEGTGLQSLQFGAQQAAKKLKLKYVVQYTLEARIEKYNENYFAFVCTIIVNIYFCLTRLLGPKKQKFWPKTNMLKENYCIL